MLDHAHLGAMGIKAPFRRSAENLRANRFGYMEHHHDAISAWTNADFNSLFHISPLVARSKLRHTWSS
jgi:hypothetical protein